MAQVQLHDVRFETWCIPSWRSQLRPICRDISDRIQQMEENWKLVGDEGRELFQMIMANKEAIFTRGMCRWIEENGYYGQLRAACEFGYVLSLNWARLTPTNKYGIYRNRVRFRFALACDYLQTQYFLA